MSNVADPIVASNPSPINNARSPAALGIFIGVTAFGLVVDLVTKSLAVTHLKDADRGPAEIHFIPGWLHFTYTENHGAVFGLGQGWRWLFLAVSLAAIVLLTRMFARGGRHWSNHVVVGMLLAGVLGNMYDRIVFGYVRDMIHAFPQWPRLFPWIFNIADSLLCVGVTLVILQTLFGPKEEQPSPSINA